MRAVLCPCFGEPAAVLRPAVLPDPVPGPGEVLVRADARSINPSDLLTVRGAYARRIPLPLVPGYEAVGRVVAVGPGVESAWIGRRVLPLKGSGTWAELIVAPVAWAVPVPDGVDDGAAVQGYINPLSVWRMLTEEADLAPGAVVVANAAGSACGRIAAQTCRDRGLRLVALTRSPAHTADLLALGAEAVVDVSVADPAPLVMERSGGRGAAVGLDAVGGAGGVDLVRLLAPGGLLLSYGLLSGALLPSRVPEAEARGVTVRGFWLRPWTEAAPAEEWHAAFRAVFARIASGALVLPVAARFDLDAVADAVRAAETPGRAGKILLTG